MRVNAVSAGPIKTLASSAVGASKILKMYDGSSWKECDPRRGGENNRILIK